MSEAGLGKNLDLMPEPPASQVRTGGIPSRLPTPPVLAAGESPKSSLHRLQARGAYQHAAAGGGSAATGGSSAAGIGPPARRQLCRGYRKSVLRIRELHHWAESGALGLFPRWLRTPSPGAVVPRALGTFGEARPSPGGTIGLGRDQDWAGAGQRSRIALAEDRHRVAGYSRASLATGLDLSHSERGRQ